MVGPFEIDPLVLLASFVVALVLPSVTVYLLAVYNTHRRIEDHHTEGAHRLAGVEDRLARLERPAHRSVNGDEQPDARTGTLLRDPEPPRVDLEEADGPRNDADAQAGGNRSPSDPDPPATEGLDPWVRAFSGCLQGRELLDREPVPGSRPPEDTHESEEEP